MSLAPGTTIGVYEVVAFLGAGGMGEVYRASDTRLNRDVAIKILPEQFAADGDRVARFQREAQVLASLNHPNIAHIYGIEQAGDARALVLELVDGPTLADRIAHGPIPLDESLPIARQIAEALEAAHQHGIIHRDLKPANVKLTKDGTVKVLDFGLAKATSTEGSTPPNLSMSPTITSPAMATHVGIILGTAAYMSPEQARGKPVDKRADIWAFGCVLYEMLTAKRAFDGQDTSDALAAILRSEPDWNLLPSDLQPYLRALMKGCLEKDPKDRIGDIAVARFLLDRGVLSAVPLSGVKRSRWMTFFPWAAAAVLAALLATTLFQRIARLDEAPRPTPSLLRVDAAVGADASLVTQNYAGEPGAALAISSDGTQLAFVAQPRGGGARLYVRRLDQLTAAPLPGTDGASAPFFSPDGKWLAFFASNRLKKIAVTGGAPVILADAANPRGGSWSEDGTIVFTRIDEGGVTDMWRVAAAGGSAERLVGLGQGEATHRWPQILPGGRAVLYTVSVTTTDYANAWLAVRPLPSGAPHIVQRGAAYGRYLTSGHLVYLHDGTLFAAPFNLTTLTLTGPPVPVVQGVLNNISTGSAQYAVSDTGVLVYTQGGAESGNAAPLAWLTRDGKMTPLRSTPLNWNGVRISPDGNQLAMSVTDTAGHTNIWIYDTARDTITRLTWDSGAPRNPVWTSDGKRVAYSGIESAGAVVGGIFWMRADGGREATRLTENGSSQYPGSWDPSDRFLAFQSAGNQVGIQILPMQGSETLGWKAGTPKVFTNGRQPRFSPDGRWVAYETSESGRIEVCVRPFPGPGGKWQVSTEGGTDAVWSRARHELLYRALDGRIMVASYSTPGDSFQVEKPRVWSETPVQARPLQGSSFDLDPDGERVVMAPLGETGATSTHVTLITNFFNELRRLAPVTTADNR